MEVVGHGLPVMDYRTENRDQSHFAFRQKLSEVQQSPLISFLCLWCFAISKDMKTQTTTIN